MNYQSFALSGSGGSTSITGSATGNNNIVISFDQTQPTQFLLDANNLSGDGYNWFTLQSNASSNNLPLFTGFQIVNNDLVMNWDIEIDGTLQGTGSALTVNNFFDIYTYPGAQFGFQSAKYTFVNEAAAIANPGVYVQTLGTMPLYLVREPNILYYAVNVLTSGTTSSDVLYGEESVNNIIYAKDGDDVMYGSTRADTFISGIGDDAMYGGNGSDTYYVDPNEADVVYDGGDQNSYDTLKILGYSLSDLNFFRDREDLLVGEARVRNYFSKDPSATDPAKQYLSLIERLEGDGWLISGLAKVS